MEGIGVGGVGGVEGVGGTSILAMMLTTGSTGILDNWNLGGIRT